jgi:phage protein D
MDVALGRSFGTFSFYHRQSLGGPARGITLLELDPLNSTLTNLIDNAIATNNYQALRNALRPYAQKAAAALTTVTSGVAVSNEKANSSVNSAKSPQVENAPAAKTLTGAQITVELGYGGKTISATSFIHVGLRYSLFEPHALEFTGQAASWVLTQRIKNTAYQKITFKKLAEKITSSYGMKLEMPKEGPLYEYFPQRGQTDYEALLIEARRIGYRVYTKGATLYIQPRKGIDPNQQIFVLQYGENMGTFFEVNHEASTDSKGGVRSSQPGSNNSTGERKFEIDPDSGQIKQKRKENVTGTGNSLDASTTGSPLPLPAPKTTGDTNASDSQRKADEDRIKGIIANAEFPTTPEALTLDPDTPFKTEGISTVLDRFWVVDTVTHEYEGGKLSTKLTCYSPITNKKATADINNGEIKVDSNNPVGKAVRQVFDNVAGFYLFLSSM